MSENTRGMQMDDDPSCEDNRPEVMLNDGPLKYTPATSEAQKACQRRFSDRGTTAVDPDKEGFLLHWIENFWDGPYSVKDNGDGTYSYSCPYTKRVDIFS